MTRLIHYFREVGAEVRKVNWPNREDTIKYTVGVIGLSLLFALFFGGLDYLFSYILDTFVL